ncbi:hypothetical protein F2S88_29745 [Pseudomonas syringae pv. actinidiae]|nr:hypothetical protein [Pseudomonas syringae pv. actinidiae]
MPGGGSPGLAAVLQACTSACFFDGTGNNLNNDLYAPRHAAPDQHRPAVSRHYR